MSFGNELGAASRRGSSSYARLGVPLLESGVPSQIGKYSLVAELARGGMGIVYLAASHGPAAFSKVVAVKELRPEFACDESYVAMFLEEARLAARLRHPNVVQTNEVGSDGARHYTVMEFLDGRPLCDIVRHLTESGGFPRAAHLAVLAEALRGIHYVHELRDFDNRPMRIVHRDFSPANVLVTFDGQVKVIDFGIAKAIDSSIDTQTGVLKGRVAYMAPEQTWGSEVDRRADVYSAGVMIWEAAAGRRLWPNMSDVEILARIGRDGPPPLRRVRPEVPRDLVAICERAMARDCAARYGSAGELLEDLEAYLASRQDQMTMREVGALVAEGFAAERRRMTGIIDEALARASNATRSGLPRFSLRDSPSTVFRAPTPMGVAVSSPARSSTPKVAKNPWGRYAALALAIVGTLLLVAFRFGSSVASAPGVPSSQAETVPASGRAGGPPARPVLAPSGDLVGVAVRASPPSAQIMVDNTVAAGNPFFARYPRDGQVHRVMAYADGFDPTWRDVAFTADVTLDVVLERHSASGPVATMRVTDLPPAAAPAVRRARPAAPELLREFPSGR